MYLKNLLRANLPQFYYILNALVNIFFKLNVFNDNPQPSTNSIRLGIY